MPIFVRYAVLALAPYVISPAWGFSIPFWKGWRPPESIEGLCLQQILSLPGNTSLAEIKATCSRVEKIEGCESVNKTPIYFYERKGTIAEPKRILALALIHGDERLAGVVTRAWMLRLNRIEPRNTWRVIPVANPDGWKASSRTNANGVDLNRNFPTKNWEKQAVHYWKKAMKSDPRRNPGLTPASEPETRCLMKQLETYKPDFVISVHTPLGVLDLDGPKVPSPPSFKNLPWMSLGNFPGSLGRYMWMDRKVPVLTIELKGNEAADKLDAFDRLQDISGAVAIQAAQLNTK